MFSAFSFAPGLGSEPGAGWVFAQAAAAHSDVWVVTSRRREPEVAAALADDPSLSEHLTVICLDLPRWITARLSGRRGVYLFYLIWQRRLRTFAADLHREIGFDVAHHVTFASDWQPCGLRFVPGLPVVWGPVGGATYQPWRLVRWLGWRGALVDVARSALTRPARRVSGDPTARHAAVVVAMNADVARRFRRARQVVIEPNFALTDAELLEREQPSGAGRTAMFVGRLVPWKGARIAISALAHPDAQGWRLELYGNGPDRPYLEGLAAELGVADRVVFHGRVARPDVLAAMTRADAFVFPSMHDSAGWAVGEASSLGCPVICLDIGGPPVLADINARPVTGTRDVVAGVARQLRTCETVPGVPHRRWSVDRLPALTEHWYDLATAPAGRE